MTTSPKIIFAGTPEFAAVALRKLVDQHQTIVAVYTQPDRPAGRGRKLTPSPVKSVALEHNIPVEQPINFKQTESLDTLQSYSADLMIVAAYGLLLPEAVLTIPSLGCINIHASLLPRWRGAAPIQRAIHSGDTKTGITIMQMDVGLDTGDMLLKKTTPIHDTDTAASLHDRLADMGAEAISDYLIQLANNNLHAEKQDEQATTYAKKLDKAEAWIDWSQPAMMIDRTIRAFYSWPIAQTQLDDKIIRIHQAQILNTPSAGPAGQIVQYSKQGIDVNCTDQQLRVLTCQLPGHKAMPVNDLFNGHPTLFAPQQHFQTP